MCSTVGSTAEVVDEVAMLKLAQWLQVQSRIHVWKSQTVRHIAEHPAGILVQYVHRNQRHGYCLSYLRGIKKDCNHPHNCRNYENS